MTTPDKEEMPKDRTAGPWIVHYGEAVKIKDANGYTVASLSQIHLHGRRSKNEVEKTARFIVIACNAYEPMREALILAEKADRIHSKCQECEDGAQAPEACGDCFPSADDARVARRNVLKSLGVRMRDVDRARAIKAEPSICNCSQEDVHDYGPCGEDCRSLVVSTLPVNDRQTSDDVGRLRKATAAIEDDDLRNDLADICTQALADAPEVLADPRGLDVLLDAIVCLFRDKAHAALKGVPQPATRHPEQIGWLVEMNDDGPKYYSFSENDPDDPWGGFQREAGNATRFARKEDAEAIIAAFAWTPGHVFASEHVWGGEKIEQPASEAGKLSSEAES